MAGWSEPVVARPDDARLGPKPGGRASLSASERRLLVLLGLPTFGLALSITIVSTYLPVVLEDFTSSTAVIGLIIGGEGLFALFLPLVIGSWSDRLDTRFAKRLPFLIVAAPVAAVALVLMPLAPSLLSVAGLTLAFFIAYFAFYPPYRALYPDLVPERMHGRAQSSQAIFRGVGLGIALGAGGLLLSVWQPLPFILAAAALLTVTAVLVARITDPPGARDARNPHGVRGTIRTLHGAATGLYGFSRGLGVVLGPLLTGVAIEVLRPWLEGTQGYSAMFLVSSVAMLLSIPLLRAATAAERAPEDRRASTGPLLAARHGAIHDDPVLVHRHGVSPERDDRAGAHRVRGRP
jgi:MFS family permease